MTSRKVTFMTGGTRSAMLHGKKRKNLPYTNWLTVSNKNNKKGKSKGTSNMVRNVKSEAIQSYKGRSLGKDKQRCGKKSVERQTIRNKKEHVIPITGDAGYSTITF